MQYNAQGMLMVMLGPGSLSNLIGQYPQIDTPVMLVNSIDVVDRGVDEEIDPKRSIH